MRQAVVNLVEAVRGLRLVRSSGAHGVRIALPPQELAPQLIEVLEALEAVEREGANPEESELAKVKVGLEGVFRWISLQGLSTDEPLEILAKALGKGERKRKALVTMPVFAPGFARKKTWKPKFRVGGTGEFGDSVPRTIEEHRKVAFVMDQIRNSLGSAVLPKPNPPDERPRPGMGPF